jgi:hypothetical protein
MGLCVRGERRINSKETGNEEDTNSDGLCAQHFAKKDFAKKDFWTTLILFTSKDDNLNKAHVQYLESRLLALARDAKRCLLDNAVATELPSLSEPDKAEMEGFLEEMLLSFPVLGVMAFEQPKPDYSSKRILYLRARGVEAKGYEAAEGFVVLAGSRAAKDTVPSVPRYLVDQRTSLMQRGILLPDSDALKLIKDYTFDSPSMAAGIMLGASYNGREFWKDEVGRTLKQIQTSEVEESVL